MNVIQNNNTVERKQTNEYWWI